MRISFARHCPDTAARSSLACSDVRFDDTRHSIPRPRFSYPSILACGGASAPLKHQCSTGQRVVWWTSRFLAFSVISLRSIFVLSANKYYKLKMEVVKLVDVLKSL